MLKLLRLAIRRFQFRKKNVFFSAFTYVNANSQLCGNNRISRGCSVVNASIGNGTYVSVDTLIGNVNIGNFCSIGPRCLIGGLGSHPTMWLSTHPSFYSTRKQAGFSFAQKNLFDEVKPTVIGSDVWIGANAIILDGLSIGSGAIIGAGSVIIKDVAPFSIVVGIPGREIKKRFSDEIISEMLDWQWWNFSNEKLETVSSYFVQDTDWTLEKINIIKELLKK